MVLKDQITITPLHRERTLHIYLPDDLGENERLPVLYMFDGHNLFFDEDASFGKCWGMRDYLEQTNTRIIVVGLECNHHGNDRLREFTPYSFTDQHLFIRQQGRKLIRWMVEELKPAVDSELPTLPGREYTWIGGSSMGGLMALYMAMTCSEVFSKAAVVSPHLYPMFRRLREDLWAPMHPDTMVYISWGGKEYESHRRFAQVTEQNLELVRMLQQKPGVQAFPFVFQNDDHTEAAWQRQLPSWMEALGIAEPQ